MTAKEDISYNSLMIKIKRLRVPSILILLTIFPIGAMAIIGGTDVDLADPISRHVVALQMQDQEKDGSIHYYKGTGIIISDKVVLTAGHNVFYLQDRTSVKAIFSTKPFWGPDQKGQISLKVKRSEVYPNFKQTPKGTEDDLALLLLDGPLPFGYSPLTIADRRSTPPLIGDDAILAGYGRDVEGQAPLDSYRLRKTTRSLSDYSDSGLEKSPKIWLDQSSGGGCGGDSGAPAIFPNSRTPTVYGVFIHIQYDEQGKGHCLTKGAFTNVIYYRDWIDQTLKLLESTH